MPESLHGGLPGQAGLRDTITNQGVLTFTADDVNNSGIQPNKQFRIDTTATLAGGGEVILNGSQTGFGGVGELTNADNTIRGAGQINVDFVNQATVRAEGLIAGTDLILTTTSDLEIDLGILGVISKFAFSGTVSLDGSISPL